jgi:DNA polymerase-3 subunit epsilon
MGTEAVERKGWLAMLTIFLNFLKEGVIVCDAGGTILLANKQAQLLFRSRQDIAPGRSLYEVCGRESLEQSLALLQRHEGEEEETGRSEEYLVCTLSMQDKLSICRLGLLPLVMTGEVGFAVFFQTAARREDGAGRYAHSFCPAVETLRSPLTNLRAAAENLIAHPEMAPVMRSAFEQVIAQESVTLSQQFETLAHECRSQLFKQSMLVDVFSRDLVQSLRHRMADGQELTLLETGAPQWLQIDSLLLLPGLDLFLQRIAALCPTSIIEVEMVPGTSRIYLDFIWQGKPLPATEIESWRSHAFAEDDIPEFTVAEILERHNSDVWSSEHEQRPGWAMVRVPLPAAARRRPRPDRGLKRKIAEGKASE